jgi:hypothetical protein
MQEWIAKNPLPVYGGRFMVFTPLSEREQFFSDVLTTAVEGGINYWAAVSNYCFEDEDGNDVPASVTVHEMDDETGDYKEPGVPITTKEIGAAITKILGEEMKYIPSRTRADIFAASIENDAGDIDADIADTIMQIAVLGEVTYG